MSKVINSRNGKKIVLLNPAEKGLRYARQLKSGLNHEGFALTDTQKAYRSGYLDSRKDSAKAYKSKHK